MSKLNLNKKILSLGLVGALVLSTIPYNTRTVNALTQPEDITQRFINSFGGSDIDKFNDVTETIDSGFVAVGQFKSTNITGVTNNGLEDAIIVKYDKDGVQQWVKSIGGSQLDVFNSVTELADGSLIAVGNALSTNITGVTINGGDGIIVKYDKDGNQLWAKTFGGSANERLYSTIETTDGGFAIVGQFASTNIAGITNNGNFDGVIVKYDSDGNQLWANSFGGNNGDLFNSVTETSDGGFVVVGNFESTNIAGLANNGNSDTLIVKYDSDGNQLWVKSLGGSSYDQFNSVIELADGGIITVGQFTSTNIVGLTNSGSIDGMIVKYDTDGNQLWTKPFGGNSNDILNDVIKTTDGGFLTVGQFKSIDILGISNAGLDDGMFIKYDSDGNQEWVKSLGGNSTDLFTSVTETTDNSFVLVGQFKSTNIDGLTTNGVEDSFIVKYKEKSAAETSVIQAETSKTVEDIELARVEVNKLPEGVDKVDLMNRLNALMPDLDIMERLSSTASADIYVTSENTLAANISTNRIDFENYNGTQDHEQLAALTIDVSSSLPYDVNISMPTEILGTGENKMPNTHLSVKESLEANYLDMTETRTVVTNAPKGDNTHSIDIKLTGDAAIPKDSYRTALMFEVVQK